MERPHAAPHDPLPRPPPGRPIRMTSLSAGRVAPGDPLALPERLLAAAAASHARACALLLALCLVCFLPGIASLQPMDRDEPRFAQASKQMLETGDLVDIRFQGEARHKKPVGIYWLQSAASRWPRPRACPTPGPGSPSTGCPPSRGRSRRCCWPTGRASPSCRAAGRCWPPPCSGPA